MRCMGVFDFRARLGVPNSAAAQPRLILLALWMVLGFGFGMPPAGADFLLDRIVAVVDDQPIFQSDIERLIVLGLIEREDGENDPDLRRRALDGLIDQRLRLREVERFDFGPVSTIEIDRQMELIRERFKAGEPLEERLASVGLDLEDLRYLLTQQFKILAYIEERLGPRVLIDVEDVREYYENELPEQLADSGAGFPPFDEVRAAIRSYLREVRLNEEIRIWTEQLRQEADIVDLLDRNTSELPPVIGRQRLEDSEEVIVK